MGNLPEVWHNLLSFYIALVEAVAQTQLSTLHWWSPVGRFLSIMNVSYMASTNFQLKEIQPFQQCNLLLIIQVEIKKGFYSILP